MSCTIPFIVMMLFHNLLGTVGADERNLERRTSVRAVLANKVDPNFWPSRGRRSEPTKPMFENPLELLQKRQNSDDEGPFWANRGRTITDMDQFYAVMGKDQGLRPVSQGITPVPIWVNPGRLFDIDGAIWKNKERNILGNSEEEGPFWANRGRKVEEDDEEERLRRDTLYVEEPGWIPVQPSYNNGKNFRRAAFPEVPNKDSDMFWVARGKRLQRTKREQTFSGPSHYTSYRNRRDNNKLSRALEQMKAQFWPSRGKKEHQ